jgi:hypothetical protein
MNTIKDIEAAIPKLSRAELEELRLWLENYVNGQSKRRDGQSQKRSVLRLRSVPGRWIGERILKSGDLADEMFARE